MTDDRAWDVEPYRPGDEAAILDLFRSEFGRERSLEHWRWQFLDNPYGGPFISLAWHRSERFLVGNQVLISETYGPGGALLKVKPGGYEPVWTDANKSKKSM